MSAPNRGRAARGCGSWSTPRRPRATARALPGRGLDTLGPASRTMKPRARRPGPARPRPPPPHRSPAVSRTRRETHESPTRSVQFNVPAIAGVSALAFAAGLGVYALSGSHERRMDREAVETARRLNEGGESDLAVRHLNQHLARRPTDLAALGLKSEILAGTAKAPSQVLDAAKVHEQFLRGAPNDPSSQDVRRRLIRLYLRYGELLQSLAGSQLGNEVIALESRYHAAEILARQLMAGGATDTEAHRLLAVSLDGMAVPA